MYELDGTTGNTLGTINVGAQILAPEEHNVQILTGLGAGDGLLVVSAGNTLTAYSIVTVPEPSSIMLAIDTVFFLVGLVIVRTFSTTRCCPVNN